MDSKRLSVLKAKTFERLGAFVYLKKFACSGQVPRLSSLHYGFLQIREVLQAKQVTACFLVKLRIIITCVFRNCVILILNFTRPMRLPILIQNLPRVLPSHYRKLTLHLLLPPRNYVVSWESVSAGYHNIV